MLLLFATVAQAQVVITEFMADNTKTLKDQDGEYSDWIEIFNESPSTVDLDGWYLTDSASQLAKWRFPGVSLAPGGFLVVFASGKNRSAPGSQLHTSFGLNAGGEYLALVKPDGTTITSEFAPEFPGQFADISYGTVQGTNYYFSKSTPGAPNSAGFVAFVADTKFSQDRGFYATPFSVTISTETTNAVIRYTTNGILPTATTGIIYTGPIQVNGTTTLRAAAYKTGYLPSNVDTHTYIFLDDVIRQSPTGQAPPGWPASWGGNVVDYGMDPDVVNNTRYSATIKNDLKAIPTFSVVMNLNDLFNSATGIYANPGQDGTNWERACSIELINPDGSKGFQSNAGIRIRGGFSRSTSNPKHAFRWFFREEYGASKLKFALFGDEGTDTFDAIDLRTFQNYSWSFQGDSRGVFIRDQFSRDSQLAMGHQGERGNYYHLYINGQYWGLYNTCERPEASYGATYFGGNKDDYDTIKVETGPYTLNATDGNMLAWTKLYNFAKAGLTNDDAYEKIQGNNADGTRNSVYENLLDVPNMIDYMLVIFYGGNLDAPISNFLGNTSPNNWYGLRNRNGPDGFRFFAHDAEHTLLDVNQDRTGPYSSGDTSVLKSSPQWIFQKCQANAEFRMLVADHVQKHFFNGGSLTPQACIARFMARKNEIDRAVVGESVRWGDAKRATPFTRDIEWVNEINRIVNSYFPQRTGIVLNQLRQKGLYPAVVAPSFNQHGGNINRGFNLTITAPAGTIYYTLDGTDPRLRGGAISPSARRYSSPLTLNESLQAKSRALNGASWSALNAADFTVIQTFTDLLITEIMYHAPDQDGVDGDQFEFIELKNVASVELDLSGVHFTNGIVYTFPNGTKLGPGKFVVLASDPAAFQKKYPGVPEDGAYTGKLSNGGEKLTLVHAVGTPIASLTYTDKAPWPESADGTGFSLVPANANANPDPNEPVNWRASFRMGGSPGADDPLSTVPTIWINEILTHTDPPQVDAIELYNPTTTPADVGHWYLTDQRATPKKFAIPAGTIIPPGGYLVLTEADFNPRPGVDPSFTLSSHGEEVYLFSADTAGNLTGYSDGFSFGAAANGVTFGRYVTSTGEIQYPAQLANTLGSVNAGPRVGPVVINEIRYHPAPGEDEFVEVKNITDSPVKLYDPEHQTNTWKLSGVDFDFPLNQEIPANGLLLVVASDPSAFRIRNSVPANVPVYGPYSGALQDNGELLQLIRPDSPDVETNGTIIVPYVVVDEVRYNNKTPWPTNAAETGASLERINARAYGNDPIAWRASFGTASPGFENSGNRVPRVNAGADLSLQAAAFPFVANLAGTASDDGLPNPPGVLRITWSHVSGPGVAAFATPNQLSTAVSFPGVGSYVVRLTADDGELAASDDVSVVIGRVPSSVTLVTTGSVWKYWDKGTDLGTAWRTPVFGDSAWASGKAQLGYGDGDEATVVSFGPDSSAKYITTYFRRTFAVANAAAVTQLTVKLLRDDGGVVYLNGVEVFRSNMPESDIAFSEFASSVISGAEETTTFFEKEVDPSILAEGDNVLAVEIHQANLTSTDISFDLELGGLSQPPNQAPRVDAGPDLGVIFPASAVLHGTAFDDGLPLPPGVMTSMWSKVSGPGTVAFDNANAADTIAHFSEPGIYVLRLTGGDGELSAQDEVTVTANLGEGLRIASIERVPGAENSIRIQFLAVAGQTYTLEYRDSLSGGGWLKSGDVPAQPATRTVELSDTIPVTASNRYYRLVTPQRP